MVMPRSRSAFSLSSTQAYLKEPFPIWRGGGGSGRGPGPGPGPTGNSTSQQRGPGERQETGARRHGSPLGTWNSEEHSEPSLGGASWLPRPSRLPPKWAQLRHPPVGGVTALTGSLREAAGQSPPRAGGSPLLEAEPTPPRSLPQPEAAPPLGSRLSNQKALCDFFLKKERNRMGSPARAWLSSSSLVSPASCTSAAAAPLPGSPEQGKQSQAAVCTHLCPVPGRPHAWGQDCR